MKFPIAVEGEGSDIGEKTELPALVLASCLRCREVVLTVPWGNPQGVTFDLPQEVDGTRFAMVHGCCWDRWEDEETDPFDCEDLP